MKSKYKIPSNKLRKRLILSIITVIVIALAWFAPKTFRYSFFNRFSNEAEVQVFFESEFEIGRTTRFQVDETIQSYMGNDDFCNYFGRVHFCQVYAKTTIWGLRSYRRYSIRLYFEEDILERIEVIIF